MGWKSYSVKPDSKLTCWPWPDHLYFFYYKTQKTSTAFRKGWAGSWSLSMGTLCELDRLSKSCLIIQHVSTQSLVACLGLTDFIFHRKKCKSASRGFLKRELSGIAHTFGSFKDPTKLPEPKLFPWKTFFLPLLNMEVEGKFHLCLPEATRESVEEGEDLHRPLVLARKNLCHAWMVRIGVDVVRVNGKPSVSAPSSAHYTVVGGE